jgi:hypothetical protein
MLISEFLDMNSWQITENEETREEDVMDFDEWLDYENDYLIEVFCEEQELESIEKSAYALYDDNEDFKRFADRRFQNYKEEHEYAGYLNTYDVSESTYESTYKNDLERYIEEHKDEYIDEYNEYERDLTFDEWLDEEKKDDIEREFQDNRYSDDYFPIWLTAWEFPSGYTAEELNELDIHGLVFFEINKNYINKTFVSLTGCGMDMSPSLYCAYVLYSQLNIDDEIIKEMLCKVQRSGLEYMQYVMGKAHIDKFIETIGKEMAIRMDKRGRAEYKKFDEQMKKLTIARDKGDMDNATTGLLGMMAYFNTQKCRVDEEICKTNI